MANPFHLTIASLSENLFEGEALAVTVPAVDGLMTVLHGHEPFVTTLVPGVAIVTARDQIMHTIPIENGVLEVSNNQATIIL